MIPEKGCTVVVVDDDDIFRDKILNILSFCFSCSFMQKKKYVDPKRLSVWGWVSLIDSLALPNFISH